VKFSEGMFSLEYVPSKEQLIPGTQGDVGN